MRLERSNPTIHFAALQRGGLAMAPPEARRSGRGQRPGQAGFTMIEIALCLVVIAFAVVAIVGVLPIGLNTQRDNRAQTIVAEDALFWLEAIRTGARGLDELTNYVDEIVVGGNTYTLGNGYQSGADIIGLLSTPGGAQATVRSITGALADKGPASRDLAFRYRLEVDNEESKSVQDALVSELRLSLRWPVRPSGVGNRTYVVRAQVNGVPVEDPTNSQRFYFIP
jgi:type II secretory pathway pseudopilin PulG